MTRFIFLGPPGAGKGTQAEILADYSHIPHISTGDILRAALQGQTPLGMKAQFYMDKGELVPDDLVQDMVRERLSQDDTKYGWILDGFPRTVLQAAFLSLLLDELDQLQVKVINLDAPDNVVMSRLLERGRKDDEEDVIRRRLEIYRSDTAPLIDYYQQRKLLVVINGNQTPEEVTAELKSAVSS